MTIQVVENGLDYSEMHERMQFYIDSNILSCCSTLVMKGTEVVDYKTFGFMDKCSSSKSAVRGVKSDISAILLMDSNCIFGQLDTGARLISCSVL